MENKSESNVRPCPIFVCFATGLIRIDRWRRILPRLFLIGMRIGRSDPADLVDHVLNTGVIIRGNLVLTLAGVDLVYLGLDLIVSSVETGCATWQSRLQRLGRRQPKR